MRTSLSGGFLFWLVAAPLIFSGLSAAALGLGSFALGLLLAPFAALPHSAVPVRLIMALYAGAAYVGAAVGVWWCWRGFRGIPAEEHWSPSVWQLSLAALILGLILFTPALFDPPDEHMVLDRRAVLSGPWLVEPAEIEYPSSAIVDGGAATVGIYLYIDESGRVESQEISEPAHPALNDAVLRAAKEFRIDTEQLGAESFPHRIELRLVLDE
jgi:TonB family protein